MRCTRPGTRAPTGCSRASSTCGPRRPSPSARRRSRGRDRWLTARSTKGRVLLDVTFPGRGSWACSAAWLPSSSSSSRCSRRSTRIATCECATSIKPEVVTYKHSAHYRAGVGCQKCHTKPGVFNYFIRNLQGVTNLIALRVRTRTSARITSYVGDRELPAVPPQVADRAGPWSSATSASTTRGCAQAGYQCPPATPTSATPARGSDVSRVVAEQDVRSAPAATTA